MMCLYWTNRFFILYIFIFYTCNLCCVSATFFQYFSQEKVNFDFSYPFSLWRKVILHHLFFFYILILNLCTISCTRNSKSTLYMYAVCAAYKSFDHNFLCVFFLYLHIRASLTVIPLSEGFAIIFSSLNESLNQSSIFCAYAACERATSFRAHQSEFPKPTLNISGAFFGSLAAAAAASHMHSKLCVYTFIYMYYIHDVYKWQIDETL